MSGFGKLFKRKEKKVTTEEIQHKLEIKLHKEKPLTSEVVEEDIKVSLLKTVGWFNRSLLAGTFSLCILANLSGRSPFASNEQVPGSPHSDGQQPREQYKSKIKKLEQSIEKNSDCIPLTLAEKHALKKIEESLIQTDLNKQYIAYSNLKTQFPHKKFEITVPQAYIDSIIIDRTQHNLFECLIKITAADKSLFYHENFQTAVNHLRNPDNIISYENVESVNILFQKVDKSQLDWLTYFTNLKLLGLAGQNLSSLPASLSGLSKLKIVMLNNNNFEQFPSFLQDLAQVENLALANNNLGSVPKTIGNLTLLKSLDLSGNNNLTELPLATKELKNLESLNIAGSPISFDSLKKVLGGMVSLKTLYIDKGAFSHQRIQELEEIGKSNNPGFTIY